MGDDASREAAKRMSVRGPSPALRRVANGEAPVLHAVIWGFESLRADHNTKPPGSVGGSMTSPGWSIRRAKGLRRPLAETVGRRA